jgi:hypothetical protein
MIYSSELALLPTLSPPPHAFDRHLNELPSLPAIFSVCNLQDVSWGTKGSTTTHDLGAAKVAKKDGQDVMEVHVPMNEGDLSEVWLQARGEIRTKAPVRSLSGYSWSSILVAS